MQGEFTKGKGNGAVNIVRMHNKLHGFLEHRTMDLDLELSLNIILRGSDDSHGCHTQKNTQR